MFPGQGSQFKGMGKALFKAFPDITENASQELGYCISTLCLNDPEQRLNHTQYTQPALYTVNALAFYQRMSKNTAVDFAIGHSLGEYNALLAAGVFDFITGLKLVKKRAELMQQVRGGSMVAVLGLESETLTEIINANGFTRIHIANFNSLRQLVLSGETQEMERALSILKAKQATTISLPASGPFHTPYLQSAADTFLAYLQDFTFAMPQLPVIANCSGYCYHPANIKENLALHIKSPVYWHQTIKGLLNYGSMQFEELGPSQILTRLLERIKKNE